ncbi:MAG: hypothetical protein LBQ28_03600 [Prevotellaceae bacterium]|jgi:hypothetical protein|nr:hypothetical protein [Prevotellaceae bacterium]
MKKLFLLIIIMLVCLENSAQTNSKGVLKNNVFQLNNGITLSKGDTIMFGIPKNAADKFTYIYEPRHAFGLLGGGGADKMYSHRMFIIHFFTTKKENNEKKVLASLGYGKEEIILDCEIAEAIENGEIIAKGKIPQRFNIVADTQLAEEKINEQPKQIAVEKTVAVEEEKTSEKPKPAIIESSADFVNAKTSSDNTLPTAINELHKNKDLTDGEHYQLLKLVTGSNDNIEGKKELVKKLQTLRDDKKLTIRQYDEIIELLLQ